MKASKTCSMTWFYGIIFLWLLTSELITIWILGRRCKLVMRPNFCQKAHFRWESPPARRAMMLLACPLSAIFQCVPLSRGGEWADLFWCPTSSWIPSHMQGSPWLDKPLMQKPQVCKRGDVCKQSGLHGAGCRQLFSCKGMKPLSRRRSWGCFDSCTHAEEFADSNKLVTHTHTRRESVISEAKQTYRQSRVDTHRQANKDTAAWVHASAACRKPNVL